jgi:hypothetical protein
MVWEPGKTPEVVAVVSDPIRALALADVEAGGRYREQQRALVAQQRRRRLVVALALAAVLALLALAIPAGVQGAQARPECPSVVLSTALLDGRYAGVECSGGASLTVVLRPGQALPAAGLAEVRRRQVRGVVTWDLVAGGVRYPIVAR